MKQKPSLGGRIASAVKREPLVLFVVLGAALFWGWTRYAPAAPEPLWIDARTVRALEERQREALGRPLTDGEARAVREDHVDDEVVLRVAIDRGLHLTDPVVRDRLIGIVRESLVETEPEPSIARVQEFFARNIERFSAETVTLEHVYFPWEEALSPGAVERMLVALRSGADPVRFAGDASLAIRDLPRASRADLVDIFGDSFADRIADQTEGEWQGPVVSDHGRHLVRVVNRHPPVPPSFDEMEWFLRQEYVAERRREIQRAGIAELRRRYDIRYEGR